MTTSSRCKKCDNWVDMAKGVCILMVVCRHSAFISEYMPFTNIAVPLFFFMSGFYDRYMPFGESIKKYSKSLLLPSLLWALIGAVFFMLGRLVLKGTVVWPTFSLENPFGSWNGPVWFTITLFYIKIIMPLLTRLCGNKGVFAILGG